MHRRTVRCHETHAVEREGSAHHAAFLARTASAPPLDAVDLRTGEQRSVEIQRLLATAGEHQECRNGFGHSCLAPDSILQPSWPGLSRPSMVTDQGPRENGWPPQGRP